VSIQLAAKLGDPVSLAELFTDVEALLPLAARAQFGVVGESGFPGIVMLAPFPVAEVVRRGRRYREDFSKWDRKDVEVELGTVASVRLGVEHRASIHESEFGDDPSPIELEADPYVSGFHVRLDAGYLRTKATFCLAVLLATAIARRSGSRIHDDTGYLRQGEWVEVSTVLAMFEKYSGAQSFEAFADAFCNDIGLAPHWPDSATLVGTLPMAN
jgi:hypothetical protein